ncbi:hypothetical protein Tco_0302953 [Tanacetum coccineum]
MAVRQKEQSRQEQANLIRYWFHCEPEFESKSELGEEALSNWREREKGDGGISGEEMLEDSGKSVELEIEGFKGWRFTPQLHESAGGLPKTKLVSHSCSLAGSTSAMEVSIPIAFVLPGREHECNESFKLGRPPALS